jgi:Fic family protein
MAYRPFPTFADWGANIDPPPLVDRYAERWQEAKASAPIEQVEAVMLEALRTAAVDTGAIEGLYATDRGFTRSAATQEAGWEALAAAKGDHVRGAIDDAVGAYVAVRDAAATGRPLVVTQAWIRHLHELVCASQGTYRVYVEVIDAYQDQGLPLGEYKRLPNSPTLPSGEAFGYASPLETPMEMERLVSEVTSARFLAAHPVVQAAYAHYAFVCIHPFADGNGRVARALASLYLFRGLGIPLVVYADQRNQYLDALEAADAGDPSNLMAFFAERAIDGLNYLVAALPSLDRSGVESSANQLPASMRGGIEEGLLLDARRFGGAVAGEIWNAFYALELPRDIRLYTSPTVSRMHVLTPPPGYKAVPESEVSLGIYTFNASHEYILCVADGPGQKPELLLLPNGGLPPFEAWRREVSPALSTALMLRLAAWATAAVQQLLAEAAQEPQVG